MKVGQLKRALHINQTLGRRAAAGYLRNLGWSIEAASWALCRPHIALQAARRRK